MMNLLSHWPLFVFSMVLCIAAAKLQFMLFFALIKRMRLFLISILFIYIFFTPGEIITQFQMSISPTYEGLYLGFMQTQKLLISLAALSLLLSNDSKEKLMLGLYIFILPLNRLGVDVERFTARLSLTLEYVEDLAISKSNTVSLVHLDRIHDEGNFSIDEKPIILETQPYTALDHIILIGLISASTLLIGLKISS